MIFLRPGLLWFLFLALIPVIIHLLNLRPYRRILFSFTRFLQKIDTQSRTRRRLKEYLILLLRVLAIAALVIAFAQPVKKMDLTQLPCQDNVVIYIDNSFSMEVQGQAGVNIDLAKKKAYEIVQAYGPNTRFIILTNDFLPSQFQSYSSTKAQDIIARVHVSDYSRTISQVVAKIKNIVTGSSRCRHYVYLISDFQRSTADIDRVVFPPSWNVYFLALQPGAAVNAAIDSVFFFRPYHSVGTKDSLVVVVHNYSPQKLDNVRTELWINDTLKGFQNLSIAPRSSTLASFTFLDDKSGWNSAYARINTHGLKFDNSLYFSFFVKNNYRILIIGDKVNNYLERLYSYRIFSYSLSKPLNIGPEDLNGYDVVILSQVKELSSGIINYLKQFVDAGGSLVLLPDMDNIQKQNQLLQYLGLRPFERLDTPATQVWNIDINSQLYRGAILEYEKNQLLPQVKKYLVRKVDYSVERPVLIGKNGTVLLSVASVGKGKVYVFAFPMSKEITDFVDNPLFVVTFVNIGLQTGGQGKLYYVIGRDRWIDVQATQSELFRIKSGNNVLLPPFRYIGNTVRISLDVQHLKAGNYSVFDQNDSLISVVGINYSRRESNLDYYTPSQISRIFNRRKIKNIHVLGNVLNNVTPVLSRDIKAQGLWKIFVVLAILFLILEVLVNRLIN